MPAIGVAMTEGLLVRWLKGEGESVAAGEVLLEIETDKSVLEVESPAEGIVGRLLFAEGDIVPTGVAVTQILQPGDGDAAMGEGAGGATASPDVTLDVATTVPQDRMPGVPPELEVPTAAPLAAEARAPHQLSPRERRLARERAETTTTNGAATSVRGGPLAPVPSASTGRHRALIAARVLQSWTTIPHFAVSREVDASAMERVRGGYPQERRPTFTDLLLRGLALALQSVGEAAGVDVGLAVATPDGVAIPVLRGVLEMDIAALSAAREDAVRRARDGRLSVADLNDPPRSTLSNLGSQGVDSFTGVIAVGQMSLMTVGRIVPRPFVIGNALGIRPSFHATLNADHRAMDGDDAARLLMAFVTAVEDASLMSDPGLTR